MIYVVDTHALIRYIERFTRLGAAGRRALNDPDATLAVPTIALAEARFMMFKKKTAVDWDRLAETMERDHRFLPVPLSVEVISRMDDGLEMHDGIVVATARLLGEASGEDVHLITRDKVIRESGLIETIW